MFRMIMNMIFRVRRAQANTNVERAFEIGSERRWIALSDAARARLAAERGC